MRHGLGALAQQWELTRFLPGRRPVADSRNGADHGQLTMPQRTRLAIEELGPTFIKLGQLASTRPDIFPPEYVIELEKLLDAAPPVSLEHVRAVIESELGEPVESLFAAFDPAPLASASIGQVHRAQLPGGERVVVKVQRPDIERVVNADLDLLLGQARFLEGRSERARQLGVVKLADEFAYALRNELDYASEARNEERFRKLFADEPRLLIPRVYWRLTTRRVLVTEEVNGIKINDLERLRAEGYDLPTIARASTEIYMRQIFRAGLFHADPHPANIFVVGGQIAQIDFGTVGYLSDAMKDQLVDLLVALVRNDTDGIVQAIVTLGGSGDANAGDMRRDVQRFMQRFYGVALDEVRVGDFLSEVFGIAHRHNIRLPADFALLGRTLVVLEGVARQLDPDTVLVEVARPFATRLMRERLSPEKISAKVWHGLREMNAISQSLPRRLDHFLSRADSDKLHLNVRVTDTERLGDRLDTAANRLALSIVVAASIVASAMLIQSGQAIRLTFFGFVLPLPEASLIISLLFAARLLWALLRTKNL